MRAEKRECEQSVWDILRFIAEVWKWKYKLSDFVSPFQRRQLHDSIPITANFSTFTTHQVRKHLKAAANLMRLPFYFKRVSSGQGIKRQSNSFLKNTLFRKSLHSCRLYWASNWHKISGEQIKTGSVQKESNRNTMILTWKISITETGCHLLE